jgi:uncharacterized protein YjbI with pentapeptide repeats
VKRIRELDINPLLADAAGVVALDARLRIAPARIGPDSSGETIVSIAGPRVRILSSAESTTNRSRGASSELAQLVWTPGFSARADWAENPGTVMLAVAAGTQTELDGKVTDTKIGVIQVWQKQDGGWKLLTHLQSANLVGALAEQACFDRADLSRARLSGANLVSSSLEGACLAKADMEFALMAKAVLQGA